jgi:hypothetical protein
MKFAVSFSWTEYPFCELSWFVSVLPGKDDARKGVVENRVPIARAVVPSSTFWLGKTYICLRVSLAGST